MLTWVTNTHEIKSNRESSYGRYDIMIIPHDHARIGYIIEFKKTRKNETIESAAKSALKQIEDKNMKPNWWKGEFNISKNWPLSFLEKKFL